MGYYPPGQEDIDNLCVDCGAKLELSLEKSGITTYVCPNPDCPSNDLSPFDEEE